jgi:type VI secretion system protein ImpI/type VI secretion system protein
MRLSLTITGGPACVQPERRSLAAGQLSIGRGPENDWVLPDPDRLLSKRHCVIGLRPQGWLVADMSSNGTYLNGAAAPIGLGRVERLQDGDRLRLGDYELRLQLEAEEPTELPVDATQVVVPAPQALPSSDPLEAFLRGAGIPAARPADPAAAMQRVGAAFRAAVIGLRETLAARTAVKGAFRIDSTMIRARGNNPLKFAAGDEQALLSLVLGDRRSDLPAEQAVTEALRDIRHHELATMAAMQTAVRALLRRLDPTKLREEGERAGGLLPAQRRARAFELFEKLHAELGHALADDFDNVFGTPFAEAYDQALSDLAAREDR